MNLGICLAALITVTLVTAGCIVDRTRFGHTEAEWIAMTPEQQAKAKEDFDRLVKSREDDRRREQMDKDMQRTIEMGR